MALTTGSYMGSALGTWQQRWILFMVSMQLVNLLTSLLDSYKELHTAAIII